jgi:hypothetical protein
MAHFALTAAWITFAPRAELWRSHNTPDDTMKRLCAGLALLAIVSTPVRGQSAAPPLPSVLTAGLRLIMADSNAAAMRVWSAGWTADDTTKVAGIRQILDYLRANVGTVVGYDLVGSETVTPHLQRFYVLLRYQRMPVYAQFVTYDAGKDAPAWMVSSMSINTKVTEVIPAPFWKH